ncbi:hypothetical protein M8J77_017031 [Diaphorina citri]|nr:hypothetical protein M8J77_017031 [Diaphorina citri]
MVRYFRKWKMSVLNQSGEEQVECPLCMEPLEVDDLNFYPCTCLYQICRFCWHRIRTDENGLCPACRKAYPEDPADFKPLSQEEVARMKAEKRQKDQQRKQKITENRKHLANVRVVQRNLVFVVGLPMRLADAEILKKHEYFGKYGKIHKVVINQSTTYAGSQGPSASAYVTYQRAEDALRAIQSINNIVVDSRVIKTSLGTTKYCSHFMKNQACPKQDCMYLHDLGDPEASFTKEAMQQGKHQEFEKKLHEQLLKDSSNNNNNNITNNNTSSNNRKINTSSPSPPVGTIIITPTLEQDDPSQDSEAQDSTDQTKLSESSSEDTNSVNKEAWPSLSQEMLAESTGTSPTPSSVSSETSISNDKKLHSKLDSNRAMSSHSNSTSTSSDDINIISMTAQLLEDDDDSQDGTHHPVNHPNQNQSSSTSTSMVHPLLMNQNVNIATSLGSSSQPPLFSNENASFFSSSLSMNGGANTNTKLPPPPTHNVDLISNSIPSEWSLNGGLGNGLTHLPDVLPPVHSSEDWEAAFGFRNNNASTGSSLHQQLQQAQLNAHSHLAQQQQQQQQQQQIDSSLLLANHLNNTPQMLSHHLNTHQTHPNIQQQQQQPTHHHHQQQQQQMSNHMSRHDDDLGFDPFHETQKALAEMIEKEEQRTRLNHYHQQQQVQNLLQQNLLQQQHREQQLQQSLLQQHREQQNLLQQQQNLLREQQQQNLLQQQAREAQQNLLQAQAREQQQQRERERLHHQVAAMFDPRGPAPNLPSNSSLYHKGASSPADLYTNALSNCTKLLDNFCLSNGVGSSAGGSSSSNPLSLSRYPPPGFSQSPATSLLNGNGVGGSAFSPKLLDSVDLMVSGSKLLPFVHQAANQSSSVNFQHSLSTQAAPAPAWDWTALDPAIMSAGQHCDVFSTPPPPGFPMRQTLDNF